MKIMIIIFIIAAIVMYLVVRGGTKMASEWEYQRELERIFKDYEANRQD